MTTTSERIEKLKSLIKRLVEVHCEVPSEVDGDITCFWCGAFLSYNENHEPNCPYMEAKAMIEVKQPPGPPKDAWHIRGD
jgi:hypothetical protein